MSTFELYYNVYKNGEIQNEFRERVDAINVSKAKEILKIAFRRTGVDGEITKVIKVN